MRLSLPSAALFDWDNTLVDTFAGIHIALNETLTAYGLPPWSHEEACRRVAKSMRDTFPALFGERWREASETFQRCYAGHHLAHLRARPGAVNLLEVLDAAGVYLGVVSNKNGAFLRREIEHLGWQGYFGGVVGAADAEADKPARAPVDLALAGSGVTAGPDVWLIGDHPIDVECAAAAGCLPILVDGATNGVDHGDIPGVRWHFASCIEIAALARRL